MRLDESDESDEEQSKGHDEVLLLLLVSAWNDGGAEEQIHRILVVWEAGSMLQVSNHEGAEGWWVG